MPFEHEVKAESAENKTEHSENWKPLGAVAAALVAQAQKKQVQK